MIQKTVLGGLGAALMIASLLGKAEAYPPFKAKEGVADCNYCHIEGADKKQRNYRGVFYKAHSLSFAGFDDDAEAKKAGVAIAPFAEPKAKSITPPSGAPAGAPPKPAGESAATKKAKLLLGAAEAKLKNKPKDANCIKGAADAHTAYGQALISDAGLLPKDKYPRALVEFTAALKLNPKDKVAAKNKKDIEDVYASMKKK